MYLAFRPELGYAETIDQAFEHVMHLHNPPYAVSVTYAPRVKPCSSDMPTASCELCKTMLAALA